MTTKIGGVVIDIDARLTKLDANLAKANSKFRRFDSDIRSTGSRIESSFAKIGTGLTLAIGALGGAALVRFAKQSLDATGGLGELAQQLGVSTDQLQIYRFAATQARVSNEEIEKSIGRLTRSLGDASFGLKEPAEAFRLLGVEIKNANGTIKSAGQVLPEIAAGLSKIESASQRASIAADLFGRSGQKLLPILEQGREGLNAYEEAARSLGVVLSSEQIQAADIAADKLAALNLVLSQRFAGVVADNTGVILGLSDAIGSLLAQLRGSENILSGRGIAGFFDVLTSSADRLKQAGTRAGRIGQLQADVRAAKQELAKAERASSSGGLLDQITIGSAASIGQRKSDLAGARDELARFLRDNPVPLPVIPTSATTSGVTLAATDNIKKAKESQKSALDSFLESSDFDFERKQDIKKFVDDSIITFNRLGDEITFDDALKNNFRATAEAIDANLEKVFGGFEERERQAEETARQFATVFSGAFEDALLSGDIGGALDGLLEDLARLVIRLTVIEPLARSVAKTLSGIGGGGGFFGSLVGSIGSLFGAPAASGSSFSGPRATGGPVEAGKSYLVGERGRELFTPAGDGTIIPNNLLGGDRPSRDREVRVQVDVQPSPLFVTTVQRAVAESSQAAIRAVQRPRLPGAMGLGG